MDIYNVIKADHDLHKDLCAKIEETHGDSQERRDLWQALKRDVDAHVAAEEETIYAVMLADPGMREQGQHSVAEHKEVDDLFEELDGRAFSDPAWLPRFRKLSHDLVHHEDEEETDVFPLLRDRLSGEEAEALGRRFAERKERERD